MYLDRSVHAAEACAPPFRGLAGTVRDRPDTPDI
jgi:hypothetical protein